MEYHYYINLNERGEFYADVRDSKGDTILDIKGFDIFEDGYMRHTEDIDGLKFYLISLGLLKNHDEIIFGN